MSRLLEPYGMVLCEGKDDSAVLSAIASSRGINDLVFKEMKGTGNLVARLSQIQASPEFTRGTVRRLLITRDADDSWDAAWQSLRDSTQSVFGISFAEPGDWVQLGENCEIALWVAPGSGRTGMIETLCLEVLREEEPDSFECLDQFADCLLQKHSGTLHEKEKFAILSFEPDPQSWTGCFTQLR